MHEYAKASYRYFFLAFSVAFFVLSLMFLSLMNIVHPKAPESLTRVPDADVPAVYAPTESDALSVLFIGVEKENSTTGTFILAKFDPARGKVPITVFPPQTAVQNGDKIETLAEVYEFGGAEYTKKALAASLGIPIDRYMRIRLDAFIISAAAVGTVEYDLNEPITISRGGASVTLNQGKQLLDGQKAADVISYSYPDGELHRCKVAADLTAQIVNQRMDICLSTVVDSVFEKIINLVSTDISYTDYYNRKHAAEFLAQVGENPATPIDVAGFWSDDKRLYTLADTFLAKMTQVF